MFAFATTVIHRYGNLTSSHRHPLTLTFPVYSEPLTEMITSTKPRHTSTSGFCTVITRMTTTVLGPEMVMVPYIQTASPRIAFCSFHPPCARSWSCLTGTTTYVQCHLWHVRGMPLTNVLRYAVYCREVVGDQRTRHLG